GRNKTYELLKSGKIKGFKIGREWKATAESVEEYIDTLVKRKDES
ncbi:MAG: helix-turn-helix domain-containing protein, partial [Oscillospiraceae bacterium]|nr:helix-turn-helix domain-containing protein [Oscillospiraceae bacterium]